MRSNLNIEGLSDRDGRCFRLWYAKINAQRVHLLDVEHLHVGVVRRNQIAHVCIARGDRSREWGSHTLKCILLFKKSEVRGKRFSIGLIGGLGSGHVLGI